MTRFAARAALPIALLVAVASLGGIVAPAVYARETASWAAQGIGQDWVNLVVAVPVLVVSALATLRGDRGAPYVLGGALLYTAYSYVIYAVAVHFNALFLVYCAVLGLSMFALIDVIAHAAPPDAARVPRRATAGVLLGVAGLFGALWLAQIVPAIARGGDPPGLAEVGLVTNPVHVLDLALVLPAIAYTGVALLRGQRAGLVLAPIALAFSVLMALAIAGMVLAMYRRQLSLDIAPTIAMGVVAAACFATLVAYVRRARIGSIATR